MKTITAQSPNYLFHITHLISPLAAMTAAALLFFAPFSPAHAQQQMTAFELAVILDTLYNKSQGTDDPNGDAARAYFENLRKYLDPKDKYLDLEEVSYDYINYYVDNNLYLNKMTDLVYKQLLAKGVANKDPKTILEEEEQALEEKLIEDVKKLCPGNQGGQQNLFESLCSYSNFAERLINQESDKITVIGEIVKKLKEDKSLSDNTRNSLLVGLAEHSAKILGIQKKLAELNNQTLRGLGGPAEGAGLALAGSLNLPNEQPTAIIIQAPGGGGGTASAASSIIDGTSKWIAERMREELSIAFFQRFETWVEQKNIQRLFPNTFASLKSSVTTDYALMIQVFRFAFEKDLKQLPFHLPDYLALELDYQKNIEEMEDQLAKERKEINQLELQIEKGSLLLGSLEDSLNLAYLEVEKIDYVSDTITQEVNSYDDLNFSVYSKYESLYERYYQVSESINIIRDQVEGLRKKLTLNSDLEIEAFKVLKYVILTTKALQLLSGGQHPTGLISFMRENADELLPNAGNIKPALVILDEVSKSLIKTGGDGNTAWLSRADQKRLKESPQLLTIFLGIITEDIAISANNEIGQMSALKEHLIEENKNAGKIQNYEGYEPYFSDGLYWQLTGLEYGDIGTFEEDLNEMLSYMDILSGEEKQPMIAAVKEVATNMLNNPNFQFPQESQFNSFYASIDDLTLIADSLLIANNHQEGLGFDFANELVLGQGMLALTEISSTNEGVLTEVDLDALMALGKEKIRDSLHQIYDDPLLVEKLAQAVEGYMPKIFGHLINQSRFETALREAWTTAQAIVLPVVGEAVQKKSAAELAAIPELLKMDLKIGQAERNYEFVREILDAPRNFISIVSNFIQFADRLDQLQKGFNELKDKTDIGPEEKIYMLRSSLEALDQVFNITLRNDEATLKTVKGLSQNVMDAYTSVLEKDFNGIVMNVMYIADSILNMSYRSRTKEMKSAIDSLVKANGKGWDNIDFDKLSKKTKKGLVALYQEKQKNGPESPLQESYNELISELEKKHQRMQEIFRYGAFLAAVVESKNSDDIKSAIRAISLPAGSYNIKRKNHFNISLNAYPGITGGCEQAFTNTETKWAPNIGFTAPIGLAVSWGYTSKIKGFKYLFDPEYADRIDHSPIVNGDRFANGSSGSLYFSLIDLGAVVLYRFDSSTDPLPENIGIQQVFAPGFAYAHGFRSIPVSLLLGVQLSPQLRKIEDKTANSLRLNASIVVDLPMVNFHTKRRVSRK